MTNELFPETVTQSIRTLSDGRKEFFQEKAKELLTEINTIKGNSKELIKWNIKAQSLFAFMGGDILCH